MQNEEMTPFITGELASMRSLILALWRPFDCFSLIWKLSLPATCYFRWVTYDYDRRHVIAFKESQHWEKKTPNCLIITVHFSSTYFSPYVKPQNDSLAFLALLIMERPSLEDAVLVLLQRNVGEKTVNRQFFSLSLHDPTGLALWRSSSLTICSELWAWNFDTQCCENTANVHTRVLVWNSADFNIYFFLNSSLVWFLLILCYYHNSPDIGWLLKFWTCSLSTLNVSLTEKPCFLETHKKTFERDSSPFLVPSLPESLTVETVKPRTCMLYILAVALGV